ncbi:MAG: cytochrome c oxidase subunit 3 [Gammaproteobacteria bacterium]|jgi:cytochrome c oxidase subunit 3|nr:cytochrome c oxidase subunit 3 [Gammaproteobacteria bacterium]
MATVITWLLRQTFNTQPWISEAADNEVSGSSMDTNSKAVALTVFLAVATSIFALFISAYTIRMDEPDWRPLAEPTLLWTNTFMLILASVAYHWTRNAAVKGLDSRVKSGLTVSGAFTVLFLVGQVVAWQQLNAAGYYLDLNPANAFFYLLTAIHGLHMLGGLWVWARSTMKVWTGADSDSVRLSIELCTVYWHFLLLVWIVLFGMLLST